ncbi:DUF3486 family protein [Rhizobiales bacterium 3FA27D7]|uniref:DUF3486 family protein n=1 Tax=Mesorhizobium sp. 2RAF21 TaxID=3232995 RepID=UPI0010F98B3D
MTTLRNVVAGGHNRMRVSLVSIGAKKNKRNSIELLPDVATSAIETARSALLEKRRTQRDVHYELCRALVKLNVDPISASAFNRWAVRVVREGRRDLLDDLPPTVLAAFASLVEAIRKVKT